MTLGAMSRIVDAINRKPGDDRHAGVHVGHVP